MKTNSRTFRNVRKTLVGALVLTGVAAMSFAAGAAKGKQAVITTAAEIQWEAYAPGVPLQVAKLWGDRAKGGEYGMLLKMPGGFEAGMHSHTLDYHAVLVQGTWVHTVEGDTGPQKELSPGAYVMQPGKQNHNDICKSKADCIVFIKQAGKGDFKPAATKPAEKAAGTGPAAAPAAGSAAAGAPNAPSGGAAAPAAAPAAPAAPKK